MSSNTNLKRAKIEKNDEFYTMLEDIEKELRYYDLKDKIIYCNCDDYNKSNFFQYFYLNFNYLGIKKLITSCFIKNGNGLYSIYDGKTLNTGKLNGNGDFRSEECIELLKDADVVVTNPPFSLFREYVKQLMDYNKKFIIIGNGNAVTYKEIFPYIKDNKLWYGVTMYGCQQSIFVVPETRKDSNTKIRLCDGKMKYSTIINTAAWFTNIEHKKRFEPLDLYKKYSFEDYPKYDNYDAINVNKVNNIPCDYDGVMGVPISFLGKYCPTQFQIIDARKIALNEKQKNKNTYLIKDADSAINGKPTYARICIKKLS